MQRLRQRRLHLHLTRANGFSRRPPERRQEVGRRRSVRNLYRPRTHWQPAELVFRPSHLRDAVQQRFRLDPSQLRPGKVLRIGLVALVAIGRPLIRLRPADLPDQPLEVVSALGELLRQRREQFRVRGRITDPHVIHRLDNPHTHEVLPHPVRQVRCEVRVLR